MINYHNESVTTVAWSPNGEEFVTGSHDIKHPLTIWHNSDDNGSPPIHNFADMQVRIDDCALGPTSPFVATPTNSSSWSTPSSQQDSRPLRLAAIDRDTPFPRLHVIDYTRRQRLHQINLGTKLTSINLSRDADEMLINLANGEVWIMGTEECELKQKFVGGSQQQYVIRSCFGGSMEGVVISGGEGIFMHVFGVYQTPAYDFVPCRFKD